MGASTIVTSSVERYLGADIISGWVPRCESGSGRGARLGLADDTETCRTQGWKWEWGLTFRLRKTVRFYGESTVGPRLHQVASLARWV